MRAFCLLLFAAVWTLLLGTVFAVAPEVEPEVIVSVHGNNVQVDVADDAGKPISGFPIRIRLPADKEEEGTLVGEGQSNAKGRWEFFLSQAGNYNVLWGQKEHVRPITIRETAATAPSGLLPCCLTGARSRGALPPPPSPWLLGAIVGLFLTLVGVSGLMVQLGMRRRATPFNGSPQDAPLTLGQNATATPPVRSRLMMRVQLGFVLLLLVGGLGLVGWSIVASRESAPATRTGSSPVQPTGSDLITAKTIMIDDDHNLAQGALADLKKRNVSPLSGALEKLLNPKTFVRVRSMPRPLLEQEAPDFELSDRHGDKQSLKNYLKKGPVVLVFYYGYFCDHCVSQLFALQSDIRYFQELGGEVVAISPDPPETTNARFKEYGAFKFPVLSDPDNKVAEAYGVFTPGGDKKNDVKLHGTFIIDREGRVKWAYDGTTPFTNNQSLLYKLAELEDKLPGKN